MTALLIHDGLHRSQFLFKDFPSTFRILIADISFPTVESCGFSMNDRQTGDSKGMDNASSPQHNGLVPAQMMLSESDAQRANQSTKGTPNHEGVDMATKLQLKGFNSVIVDGGKNISTN